MVVTNVVVCMQNVNISTKIYLLSIFTKPPPTMISAAVVKHSILTFVRTIFPGVWEESVMRHGGQASDEIEDDLYQYNII